MNLLYANRQQGKTHACVQWVLQGVETNFYPFWTRVMLVSTIQEATRVRALYPELDYRQVFSFQEWRNARRNKYPVEVAIDNIEFLLGELVGSDHLALATTSLPVVTL